MSVSFRNSACAGLLPVLLALWLAFGGAAAHADEAAAQANRQFIQAMQLVRKANATYEAAEEGRLLGEADRLLADIITRFSDTDLAVQLVTNQFVGDFDFYEFRNRLRSMVCTDQQSSKCFLFRIGNMLPAVETPIVAARWDWLSLAVASHLMGDQGRAKEIIAPFLSAVRRGVANGSTDRDLYVSRALALTGQEALALDLTRKIPDCATRLYNLTDIAEIVLWHGDKPQAAALAEEARAFAAGRTCVAELGLVARTLYDTGRGAEAATVFATALERQVAAARETNAVVWPPELVVAAADLGDPSQALARLRGVQEEASWTVAAVLGRLARRSEMALALSYAEGLQDADLRGEAYAELIERLLVRDDRPGAEALMAKLVKLAAEDGPRRPPLIAERARAEKALYRDERWRPSFQQALTAAENASGLIRRDIGGPMLAILVRIETGLPMLD
ncbi:MAG: hypothetical protein WCO00_01870 [Rhodospirillaceae bacterium]